MSILFCKDKNLHGLYLHFKKIILRHQVQQRNEPPSSVKQITIHADSDRTIVVVPFIIFRKTCRMSPRVFFVSDSMRLVWHLPKKRIGTDQNHVGVWQITETEEDCVPRIGSRLTKMEEFPSSNESLRAAACNRALLCGCSRREGHTSATATRERTPYLINA